jgi:effector-binding domain-containing protein
MNVSTPEIQEIGAREVASVSFTGNYPGNASVFEKLFGTLCGLGRRG